MKMSALIRSGQLSALVDLLRAGADVNERDPEGWTPLMVAASLGRMGSAELLLDAGADVLRIESCMGTSALHKAAQSGNVDVIGLLLDRGAFVDQQSPSLGHTPLMDAVAHKHLDAVQLLLGRGARTEIQNHWHQTALALAELDQGGAIVSAIKARQAADAEKFGDQALMDAIRSRDVLKVEQLLASGVSLEERVPTTMRIEDDYTPLGLAAREGHAEIVRLLLDAGAERQRTIGLMRGTPLHEASFLGHMNVVSVLTDLPGAAEATVKELWAQGPYNGFTPLHDAIWHGHLGVAKALVNAGAPLHLRTHAGLTPRDLAELYGYEAIVELLTQAEREVDRG